MDIKAMAKSKRSHTQHHQPRKPYHPPKNSSSSSAAQSQSGSKPSKKEGRDGKRATQQPTLPSNWDRYDNEKEGEEDQEVPINSDSDEPSGLATKTGVDVVKPKSKGADFSYLIAQAKESRTTYSPSLDDALPDFYQGLAPVLAVKGEYIHLWDGDDFFVENEAATAQEAPFFTLNLKDLADRLAKVDLAKRLFIEPDLLPPDLRGQDVNGADNQVLFQTPDRRKNKAVDTFDELLALYLEEEQMTQRQDDVDKNGTIFSSDVSSTCNPVPALAADVEKSKLDDTHFLDARETRRVNQATERGKKGKFDDKKPPVSHVTEQDAKGILDDLGFLGETVMPQASHVTEQDTRPSSRFEAAASEADLDVLLESFNETKLFDSPATQAKFSNSMNQQGTSASVSVGKFSTHGATLQHSLGRITSSLDDELDDLLAETSKLKDEDGLLKSTEIKVASLDLPSSSSSSNPGSKSKVLEDFGSWLDTI